METGRTVVLLNLEEVYESLYDALNQVCHCVIINIAETYFHDTISMQYYREYGAGTRFVDIGLQSHRIKCSVHNEFKSVILLLSYPTPMCLMYMYLQVDSNC